MGDVIIDWDKMNSQVVYNTYHDATKVRRGGVNRPEKIINRYDAIHFFASKRVDEFIAQRKLAIGKSDIKRMRDNVAGRAGLPAGVAGLHMLKKQFHKEVRDWCRAHRGKWEDKKYEEPEQAFDAELERLGYKGAVKREDRLESNLRALRAI